ncbi:peptidoglycan DD-metalloendopeptidase family protein [Pseudarthrobacter sp. PS3-L1]|uniref:M23 family metallopeptidase n=1 Tax=Pseudarthrobacter sp. PS3-L1 TaxID=3046207 RepID=UPI0024BAB26E|nr:peptidoglycan DD-metalloendopeptidase family protein [Pseudarthrobacter sp. PS3-L1]MDJ0320557.1 peptidoglycan DD-metalloendopeptidase family protein [Pseudarthrobacter sp. PS3-L1]
MATHRQSGHGLHPMGACAAAARIGTALLVGSAAVVGVGLNVTVANDGPATAPRAIAGPLVNRAPGGQNPQTTAADAQPVMKPGISADPAALLSFSRTVVRTLDRNGKSAVSAASANLRRPPQGSLMAPLEVLAPSSPFGYRISPLSSAVGDFHLGQDYAAACGARVYAADEGIVRAAGWHPWGGGNRVEIDHGNGLITTYNHLQAIAVRRGESVAVGQIIALVGTTGSSTGCHLHFETLKDGIHVNPSAWSLLPTRQLDPVGTLDLTDYSALPDKGGTVRWAIPAAEHQDLPVAGGANELPAAPTTMPGLGVPAPVAPTLSVPTGPAEPTPDAPAPAPTSSVITVPSATPSGAATAGPLPSGSTSPVPVPSATGSTTAPGTQHPGTPLPDTTATATPTAGGSSETATSDGTSADHTASTTARPSRSTAASGRSTPTSSFTIQPGR